MKPIKIIIISVILLCCSAEAFSQDNKRLLQETYKTRMELKRAPQNVDLSQGTIAQVIELDGDSILYFPLPTYYCYPKLKFKNKKQEKFYWRTVRDVKRVLPLSKYVKETIDHTNNVLMALPNEASRDNYMKNFEKKIYRENEERFKQLTLNQGKLLIRLIERETTYTSYDLIKAYRGSFRAGFWQAFAKVFGADLKSSFGSKEEDEIISRVITLVEAGQL